MLAQMQDIARQHAPQALETLVEIMVSSEVAPAARIAAANAILDRGLGKPAPVALEPTAADVRHLSDAELMAIVSGEELS